MKIKVIENAYYVSEDLTSIGLVSENEFQSSFSHLLVVGDVWERNKVEKGNFVDNVFTCIEGQWKGEVNDGWWDYEDVKDFFKVIED